jgi:hypothetical protein
VSWSMWIGCDWGPGQSPLPWVKTRPCADVSGWGDGEFPIKRDGTASHSEDSLLAGGLCQTLPMNDNSEESHIEVLGEWCRMKIWPFVLFQNQLLGEQMTRSSQLIRELLRLLRCHNAQSREDLTAGQISLDRSMPDALLHALADHRISHGRSGGDPSPSPNFLFGYAKFSGPMKEPEIHSGIGSAIIPIRSTRKTRGRCNVTSSRRAAGVSFKVRWLWSLKEFTQPFIITSPYWEKKWGWTFMCVCRLHFVAAHQILSITSSLDSVSLATCRPDSFEGFDSFSRVLWTIFIGIGTPSWVSLLGIQFTPHRRWSITWNRFDQLGITRIETSSRSQTARPCELLCRTRRWLRSTFRLSEPMRRRWFRRYELRYWCIGHGCHCVVRFFGMDWSDPAFASLAVYHSLFQNHVEIFRFHRLLMWKHCPMSEKERVKIWIVLTGHAVCYVDIHNHYLRSYQLCCLFMSIHRVIGEINVQILSVRFKEYPFKTKYVFQTHLCINLNFLRVIILKICDGRCWLFDKRMFNVSIQFAWSEMRPNI